MKKLVISVFALFMGFGLFAQSGTMFNFSRLDQNSITAGQVAGMATSSLAYGAYANPSLMPFFEKKGEISFNYQMLTPSVSTTHNPSLGMGFRLGKRCALSLAGTYFIAKPYDVIVSPSGATVEQYTPGDLQAGIGFACKIINCLSLGINGRFYYSNIAEDAKYMGFGMNAFLAYHEDFGGKCLFTATAGVTNVGPKVKNIYSLPSSATAALGVKAPLGKVSLAGDVDFDYYFNGGISLDAGAEFGVCDRLFLRGGYHFAANANVPVPSYASVGISVYLAKCFSINGNYVFASQALANTFSAGLEFKF